MSDTGVRNVVFFAEALLEIFRNWNILFILKFRISFIFILYIIQEILIWPEKL